MKEFEKAVIEELLQHSNVRDTRVSIPEGDSFLEFSGFGYFLTIRNPALPKNRKVFNKPNIQGKLGGVDVGYLAFVENSELVLECYSYDREVTANHRDKGFLRNAT